VRLSLSDLPQVLNREDDPPAVLMERNLPTVRASSQRALGQVFEPKAAQDRSRLSR
jgi:hypothetical protein